MTTQAASPRRGLLLRVLALAAVFILVHILTLHGAVSLALAVLICMAALGPMTMILRRTHGRRWVWLFAGAGVLLAAAVIAEWPGGGTQVMLVAPPFLGCLAASAVFAHSLLPGEEPIITRLCRISRGNILPDGLAGYARRLTWGWALLPAFLGFAALLAFAALGIEAWSWISNVVTPAALVAFFIGEHVYRGFRHPHLGRPSILQTFDVMLSPTAWRK